MDSGVMRLVSFKKRSHQLISNMPGKPFKKYSRVLRLLVQGQADSQTKFRIVFKKRIRPGRPQTPGVHAVGRGGKIASVNGRATCGVGDDGMIPKQLGDQLDVGRLSATRAGA